jgi:hypothetical protein
MRHLIELLATASLGFAVSPAFAQSPATLPLSLGGAPSRIEWGQVVASDKDDWINDLVRLRNGNVLGVGFVGREDGNADADWLAVAAELAPDGKILSDHRYGDHGGTDAFWAMAEAADGRRMFAGLTTRLGPAGINGYVLLSGADGIIVRENGFGYAGYDRFTDLAPAPGGYVFVGHSQLADPGARRRTYLMKADANGLPLWERIYGGPETWSALYIEPAGDGGFVISGGTDGGGDGDMFVLKVDADGREQWRKRVGTTDWDEVNHGMVVRPDGSIILIGYTNVHGSDLHDWVAATLPSGGDLVRLERYGGAKDERAISAKLDEKGVIWMIGHTESTGQGGTDLLLSSIDANGSFTGVATTLGGVQDDMGTAVLPLGQDSILVAGYSRNLGRGGEDAFIARLTRPAGKSHPALKRTVVTPAR